MSVFIVVLLFLVGIALILLEIFLIPGVTLAALFGAVFSIGGICYAYYTLGAVGGTIALVSGLVLFGIIFIWLIKSKALDAIALKTDINSTVASKEPLNIEEGDRGITVSRLNPIGKVRVNYITMEAKTLGEFIDENTPIEVVKVTPVQLTVKTIN